MNTTKLNSFLAFALITLFSFSVQAQDYAFSVTGKKGSATVGGEELKVGSKIQETQQLVVGANTLLNIVHKGGKSLVITKAGSYKVADLAKGCASSGKSLASKYADFVLKELTSENGDGVKGKNMSKSGSVKRAASIPGEDKATLLFASASKSMEAAPTKIALKCFLNTEQDGNMKDEDITKYTFVVNDFMGEELAKIEADTPIVTIDLSEEKYSSIPAITYYAYINDNPKAKSAEYAIKLIKGSNAQQITADAKMLGEDGSALSHLIQARYFEEKGLHANAIYAFEKALKKSNEDEMYHQMYQAYLDRNYLSKKSKKKLKKDN